MGIIFSRFKRKKTTDEILEEIQSDIQSLEDNREMTLQRQKFWIGRLYIYSVLLYALLAVAFYFCFFPVSLKDRLFYIIPLLGFPVIVFLLHRIITWYFKREIVHSKDKLADLKAQKKKILDDVMNKETYKVAKEILEKYAPEQLKKSPEKFSFTLSPSNLPETPNSTEHSSQNDTSPKSVLSRSLSPQKEPRRPAPQPQAMKGPGPPASSLTTPPGMHTPQKPTGPMVLQRQPSPQRRLVRPIIPRERNLIDKIIESIVGDGPSNRYALICRNCASHNGMALKEEFEYLAFRCAYCGFPNPAHKVRPRPSVQLNRDRSSSEERKSIESNERRVEHTDDEKGVDGENKDVNLSSVEEKTGVVAVNEPIPQTKKPANPLIGTDDDDDSCIPADGVRPRKPLHLADD